MSLNGVVIHTWDGIRMGEIEINEKLEVRVMLLDSREQIYIGKIDVDNCASLHNFFYHEAKKAWKEDG